METNRKIVVNVESRGGQAIQNVIETNLSTYTTDLDSPTWTHNSKAWLNKRVCRVFGGAGHRNRNFFLR
jgi:hypothetical protein